MRRLLTLALLGSVLVSPAFAQQQQPARAPAPAPAAAPAAQQPSAQQQARQPAVPVAPAQPQAQAQPRTGFGANHALALGIGMFGGAVLGSAMIHGGSFAAAVGAVAGLTAGHWYYTQHGQAAD